MPKTSTPKWAVIASWKRYSLHSKKADADDALTAWKERHEAEGFEVKGAKSVAYIANSPEKGVASRSARVVKLADHPLCYIGVRSSDVEYLRKLESEENPAFERYCAAAKALNEGWEQVEAV